jgi:hypothetical protein
MTFQGVRRTVRLSRRHAVLAVVAGAVVAVQLGTLATLAQAQVDRGQARQERVVAKLVSGDPCLDYKISAPRAGCTSPAAFDAGVVPVAQGWVHLAATDVSAGPAR